MLVPKKKHYYQSPLTYKRDRLHLLQFLLWNVLQKIPGSWKRDL